jgi:hypothetical protein
VERLTGIAPNPRWVNRCVTSLEYLRDSTKAWGRCGRKTSFERIVYSDLVGGGRNDLSGSVQRKAGNANGADQRMTIDFATDYDVIAL